MDTTLEWAGIAKKIEKNDVLAVERLYAALPEILRKKSLRPRSCCEDDVHEILLIVLETIYRGQLRDPDKLVSFITTVARRRAVAQIRQNMVQRRRLPQLAPSRISSQPSPEEWAVRRERTKRLYGVLARLQSRDRNILIRFYLLGQPPEQICRELRLTSTQFRLSKSRALTRCAGLSGD